jgi:hypothetical protein
MNVPDLIAHSPLRPGTCQSVRMRFLAIQPGSHSVDTLTLTDVVTGFATNLRYVPNTYALCSFPIFDLNWSSDTMNVVVHKREETTSQVITPAAEISVAV